MPAYFQIMRRICLFLWLFIFPLYAYADEVVIAVLAFSGEQYAKKSWQPTVDYLQTHIPEHDFKLIAVEPINVDRLEYLVEMEEVDFVITQPITYVDLAVLYGAVSILTLVDKSKYAQFGSVIFTHADNSNINQLTDINNPVIAAASPKGLGGWLIGYNTFLEAGVDLHKQAKAVRFLGVQDNIVKAILSKTADVGIVRTGVLERMIDKNILNVEQLHIINSKNQPDFPYYLSTALYPEWALAKTQKVSNKLAKQVASVLLSMPENSIAAQKRGYWEWISPIDYQPIHTLMKKLKIGAYANYGKVSLIEYIKQHILQVALFIIVLLMIIIASIWIFRLNRGLKKAQYSLTEQHHLILNSVDDGIYGVDLSGQCTFINKAMTEITGWQASDLIGKQQHDILHHSHSDGSHFPVKECPVYHTFVDGKSRFIEKDIFWKKDGNFFAVEYSCTTVKDKNQKILGSVVVFRDISEKQKTAQMLAQYQSDLFHRARVNTMGEMVSGIAHELNQPLVAITSSAYAGIQLLESKQPPQQLSEILLMINTQADRAARIIKQLRQFISKTSTKRQLTDVNQLIQDVLKIIQIEADKLEVKIICQLEKNLSKTLLEPIQIDQVILSLCKNALEAMQETSGIKRQLAISTRESNGNIVVAVKDNALGVSDDVKASLFNPFVTQKPQGMGLGLSISKDIIEAHNGEIYLKSSLNKGSTFEFILPITADEQ